MIPNVCAAIRWSVSWSDLGEKKLLIIRFSSFGDLAHVSACLPTLQAWGAKEIQWVTRAEFAEILRDQPRIQRVWGFDRRLGLSGLWKLGTELAREGFSHVYDAHNNPRSRLLVLFLWLNSLKVQPGSPNRGRSRYQLFFRNQSCSFVFRPHFRLRTWLWLKGFCKAPPSAVLLQLEKISSPQKSSSQNDSHNGDGVDFRSLRKGQRITAAQSYLAPLVKAWNLQPIPQLPLLGSSSLSEPQVVSSVPDSASSTSWRPSEPALGVSPQDKLAARLLLDQKLPKPNRGFIALGPSATYPLKRWPIEYWIKLIAQLPDHQFVILGGKDDHFLQQIIDSVPGRAFGFWGELSWRMSMGIIANSELLISNDTGIAHFAEQMGLPVLLLLGPTAWGRLSPSEISFTAEIDLPCRPCTKFGKDQCRIQTRKERANSKLQTAAAVGQKCLRDLKPEFVAAHAKSFFENKRFS